MCNYIVRICRSDKNNPRGIVGVVEEVGVNGKRAFTNYDELWEILNSTEKYSTSRSRRSRSKGGSGIKK